MTLIGQSSAPLVEAVEVLGREFQVTVSNVLVEKTAIWGGAGEQRCESLTSC
jgi:hypothetical protein